MGSRPMCLRSRTFFSDVAIGLLWLALYLVWLVACMLGLVFKLPCAGRASVPPFLGCRGHLPLRTCAPPKRTDNAPCRRFCGVCRLPLWSTPPSWWRLSSILSMYAAGIYVEGCLPLREPLATAERGCLGLRDASWLRALPETTTATTGRATFVDPS